MGKVQRLIMMGVLCVGTSSAQQQQKAPAQKLSAQRVQPRVAVQAAPTQQPPVSHKQVTAPYTPGSVVSMGDGCKIEYYYNGQKVVGSDKVVEKVTTEDGTVMYHVIPPEQSQQPGTSWSLSSWVRSFRLWPSGWKGDWREKLRPPREWKVSLSDYIRHNRWSLLMKSSIGIYVIINYRLFSTARFLLHPDRWMYWRSDIFLTQLVRVAPHDLVQELLVTLSTRGRFPPDKTPLEVLLEELDEEIRWLRWYLGWGECVEQLNGMHQHILGIFHPKRVVIPLSVIRSIVSQGLQYVGSTLLGFINVKKLFYVHEELMTHGHDYLRRLIFIRHAVEEELTLELAHATRW